MEAQLPTERTPLIENHSTSNSVASPSVPFILEVEREIYSDSDYPAIHRIIERKVDAISTSPSTTATLKLLLCLRYLSGSYFLLGQDNWIDSRAVEQDANELAVRCWMELQRVAWSQATLDEALWTGFPVESGKEEDITLIETIFSNQNGIPPLIQLDDRIALSLLRAWKNGRPRSVMDVPASIRDSLWTRIESFASPRVLHLVDLASYFAYLAILTHYLTRPVPFYYPDGPSPLRPDFHFYCVAVYVVSRLLKDSWTSGTPPIFLLTLVAFLSALPAMPRQYDNSYQVLLFCFFMHVVQLVLPFSPSFPLLRPRSVIFTVSSMLCNLFTVVFVPALTFFIPIILVMLFILVLSLRVIFTAGGLVAWDLFLFCLWISGLLFTCLAAYMTLSSSSLPLATFHHPDVPESWNSYGPKVGVSLRRHLCRSVITYSRPYFFPAPSNLISSIFVRSPHTILHAFGDKHVASWLKSTVQPMLWRVIVLPPVFVFGVAWLWK